MRLLHNRFLRVALLCLLLLSLGLHLRAQRSQLQAGQQPTLARYIPPTGLAENDTKGRVPGDSMNGVEDLKRISQLVDIYKKRHNGELPSHVNDILTDAGDNLREYGHNVDIEGFKKVLGSFLNPDSQYADDPGARKNPSKMVVYDVYNKRPDGSKIGADKPPGTKDVLASTGIYYHRNVTTFPKQRSTLNPVGYYLVLWDDRTIERIPYDRMLYVPTGNGQFSTAFPNQPGTPANALSYDEFYRAAGWKKGPRGAEGAPGVAFNGKPLR